MHSITNEEYEELLIYKRICKLDEYAYEFWTNALSRVLLSNIFKMEPPIRYTREDMHKKYKYKAEGSTNSINFARVTIFHRSNDEELEAIIRHELIHCALGMLKLKQDDNCAVFKIMCDIFDGKFYGVMNEIEEEIYNNSYGIVKESINIFEKTNNESIRINIGLMFSKIGNLEINKIDDAAYFKTDVEFLYKTIKDFESIIK